MLSKLFNWIGTGMVSETMSVGNVFAWIVGILFTALTCVGIFYVVRACVKHFRKPKYHKKK